MACTERWAGRRTGNWSGQMKWFAGPKHTKRSFGTTTSQIYHHNNNLLRLDTREEQSAEERQRFAISPWLGLVDAERGRKKDLLMFYRGQ